jgi:type III pantothenate kinase
VRLISIDQGNTRTKLGLFEDGSLRRTWSFPTVKDASPADLERAVFLPGMPHNIPLGLCSVVPEMTAAWQALAECAGSHLTILTGCSPTPLRNAYATPQTLGPDRLLAAVAASELVGAPVLSISLGTATVVDAVTADRVYLGGMIAPGIGVIAGSLSASASALHPVPWQIPAHAIGHSTDEALTSGWFYQALGGIQAMIRATRDELGQQAPLALTGGWSSCIAPHLDGVALVDEYLILRGVAITLGPQPAP